MVLSVDDDLTENNHGPQCGRKIIQWDINICINDDSTRVSALARARSEISNRNQKMVRLIHSFFSLFSTVVVVVVNFVSPFVSVCSTQFIVHFDTHRKKKTFQKSRIDKTKLNIIYIWVSLLGCLIPLPNIQLYYFLSSSLMFSMKFNVTRYPQTVLANLDFSDSIAPFRIET